MAYVLQAVAENNMRALTLFFMVLCISCGPSKRGLFGEKKSAHEKYSDRLKEAGLDKTLLGNSWLAAAQNSLNNPLSINLPHKEAGYFPAAEPRADGYVFDAKRGSRLNISVTITPPDSLTLFAELWQRDEAGKTKMVAAADSTLRVNYEVEEDGAYVLRLQPQLLESMEYSLAITTTPSLAFPVSETGNPKLISFWQDPRDLGARSHEGVDISANFRTPAVAAADGRIQRVTDNRLGGKVVFMRPANKTYTLYYAHLDSQMVSTGQSVIAGQTLGLVGNTGNAKGTVPHLHFGIYAWGGAVDPLPFIDPRILRPAEINASTINLDKWMRTSSRSHLFNGAFPKADTITQMETGTVLKIVSATSNLYRVVLPDGRQGYLPAKNTTSNPLRTLNIDSTTRLLDRPHSTAAARSSLHSQTSVSIIGRFGDYYLAQHGNIIGWINK